MDKYNAGISLQNAAYSPRKLLLIHSGALLGLSLVLSAISYLLNFAIQPSGGLGSMNLQALLSTAQVGLQLIQTLVTPLWAAGLIYIAISIARGNQVAPRDLAAGFQKFGPIFTSTLMVGLQYLWRVFLSTFLSAQILSFTPVATKLYEATANIEDVTAVDPQVLLGDDYIPIVLAYLGVTLLVMLVLVLPVFYRYRLTTYLIMDGQERGGSTAMLRSRILMFGRRWELAKLDLSFWWYYLLLMLSMSLSYGDVILDLLGVTLPIPSKVTFWGFLVLGLLAQLAVQVLAGPKVAVTYAHCYDRFLHRDDAVEDNVLDAEM